MEVQKLKDLLEEDLYVHKLNGLVLGWSPGSRIALTESTDSYLGGTITESATEVKEKANLSDK